MLSFFREMCASASDELMLAAGMLTAPDGSGAKLVGIIPLHCGSLADGEKAVKPIKAFGPPVMDMIGPMPYCTQNTLLDPSFPKGALNYWKASFLTDLTDEAIGALLDRFSACPSPMSQIVIEHFHGKAQPRPGRRHGVRHARHRIQRRDHLAVDRSRPRTTGTSRGAATPTRRYSRIWRRRGT